MLARAKSPQRTPSARPCQRAMSITVRAGEVQRDFEAADGGGAEIVFVEAGAPDAGARAARADDVDLFMVVDTCGHLPQGGR